MTDVFCKKTLNEIVPSAKAILAEKMARKGMKQKDIAKLLKVTQPAVSQYTTNMRGKLLSKMKSDAKLSHYFNGLANDIVRNNVDVNEKTCEICEKVRSAGIIPKDEMTPFICIMEMVKKNDKRA